MITRIVSGGQTGVDRAALDAALAVGMACGGWCPRGRKAEDGAIPERYPLRETGRSAYIERTRLNIRDSDGTLVLASGPPTGGTRATIALAGRLEKPCLVIDLADAGFDAAAAVARVHAWLDDSNIRNLNVAGPRESSSAGIYAAARTFLATLLGDGGEAVTDE